MRILTRILRTTGARAPVWKKAEVCVTNDNPQTCIGVFAATRYLRSVAMCLRGLCKGLRDAPCGDLKCTPRVGHKKKNYVQRIETLFRREDAGCEPV